MKARNLYLTFICSIFALVSLFGCSTRDKAYLMGYAYEDNVINATIVSAEFTDKLTISGNDVEASADSSYLIVDIDMSVKSGKWSDISDFEVSNGAIYDVRFDRDTTAQLNGFDLFEINSTEKQSIRVVFLIKNADVENLNSHTFYFCYSNGLNSHKFALGKMPEE